MPNFFSADAEILRIKAGEDKNFPYGKGLIPVAAVLVIVHGL